MEFPPTYATCSYVEFDPSYGIPVRATLGRPRFKLRYPLSLNLQEAAPSKEWFRASYDEFNRQYFAKLDRAGVEFFRNYASKFGGERTLVLLCFERLDKDECHRTLFAEWWHKHTGETVPEYGRTRGSDPKPVQLPGQVTLF